MMPVVPSFQSRYADVSRKFKVKEVVMLWLFLNSTVLHADLQFEPTKCSLFSTAPALRLIEELVIVSEALEHVPVRKQNGNSLYT